MCDGTEYMLRLERSALEDCEFESRLTHKEDDMEALAFALFLIILWTVTMYLSKEDAIRHKSPIVEKKERPKEKHDV